MSKHIEIENAVFSVKPWTCISCKFLLGYIEDKKIVRVKRKDLYIEIEGGKININCPRCGKRNELIDEKERR